MSGASLFTLSIRVLQLICAFGVLVIYALDLPKKLDIKELVGTIVGGFSFLLVGFLLLARFKGWNHTAIDPKHLKARLFETCMPILWAAIAGVFGTMYIGKHPANVAGSKIRRMRIGVYLDLVNTVLWMISSLWTWLRYRKALKGDPEDFKIAGTY